MTDTPTIYLDAAELAAIIRTDLSRAFPGVRFSVKTQRYSGGSSVRVRWTDGPLESDVDALIGRYKAEGFDGMTDSRTNRGPVRLDDGRSVQIHSFVFTSRDTSPALQARVAAYLARHPVIGQSPYVEERRGWRLTSLAQIVNGHLIIRHDGQRYS